jgi:hypothetical protein
MYGGSTAITRSTARAAKVLPVGLNRDRVAIAEPPVAVESMRRSTSSRRKRSKGLATAGGEEDHHLPFLESPPRLPGWHACHARKSSTRALNAPR